MAKLLTGLLSLGVLFSAATQAAECRDKSWQFSKLDIEVDDIAYLKTVMGFSYGPEVTQFIPHLGVANSNMFFVESKAKPLVTYFTAEFKSADFAKNAFNHLKAKWSDNKYNQYDVIRNGNSVTWFGNNRLSPSCFKKVVSEEKVVLR